MASMFKSAHMQCYMVTMQSEVAPSVLDVLGEHDGGEGIVEFRDLQGASVQASKRPFVDEVRQCDDLNYTLEQLGYLLEEEEMEPAERDTSLSVVPLDQLKVTLDETMNNVNHQKNQLDMLNKHHNSLAEQKVVLEYGARYYKNKPVQRLERTASMEEMSLANPGMFTSNSVLLNYVTGTISREMTQVFQRICFRQTRGNIVFHSDQIRLQDPKTGREFSPKLLSADGKNEDERVEKDFFMIIYLGAGDASIAVEKLKKIATHVGANLYTFPDDANDRIMMKEEVEKRIKESDGVLAQTKVVMKKALEDTAEKITLWKFSVFKEKKKFDTLNMCTFSNKMLAAHVWVPVDKEFELRSALVMGAQKHSPGTIMHPSMQKIPTNDTPPTYIPTNKFTSGFQALVNTYGTPRYREVNAGLFCTIFFPFLFGIMFGDMGHAMLLFLFASTLIMNESSLEGKKLDDMMEMLYGGRYVMLLNGFFGMYMGLMYNEIFAVPMNWVGILTGTGTRYDPECGCDPVCGCLNTGDHDLNGIYEFGIDPMWHHSTNRLTYFNSFKMKISIIIGVLQMTFGIILNLVNHIEYRDWKRIVFQFLPEMGFFAGIFGYLVWMIFYKWSIDWRDPPPGTMGPPALLNVLIQMFMSPGLGDVAPELALYQGQGPIQFWILVVGLISVPLLLFPIPFLEQHEFYVEKRRREKEGYVQHVDEDDVHDDSKELADMDMTAKQMKSGHGAAAGGGGGGDHGHNYDEEFRMDDAFVHQFIHVIEFVLGGVSNTASYLRLWALSLAHTQLSELMWEYIMVVAPDMAGHHWLAFLICTFLFCIFTTGVLLFMDNLECFLHALRLQWVEFQSKFYHGDGVPFMRFNFKESSED